MTKYKPSESDVRQVLSPTAVKVLGMSIRCPDCELAVRETERKKKELLAQNEAALVAHKKHGNFLEAQIAKSWRDQALNKVFNKLFEDCVLLQAGKVVKILLAQDKDFSKRGLDRLRMIKAAAENLKIMESAAWIHFNREKSFARRFFSVKTQQLPSKLNSWIALNYSISSLPYAASTVDTTKLSSNKVEVEAAKWWKTAVTLAKGMELDG